MKKRINRGIFLTLALLLCVLLVAFVQTNRMSKEKMAACAVVTEALKEYLDARTLPSDVRMDIKNGIASVGGNHTRLMDAKIQEYRRYLETVMYDPMSYSTQLMIDEMLRSAQRSLEKQYNKATQSDKFSIANIIDGYHLEEKSSTRVGILKNSFSINADFTEIVITVEHAVTYDGISATTTERDYSLIKVDGEWKIYATTLNLNGVS